MSEIQQKEVSEFLESQYSKYLKKREKIKESISTKVDTSTLPGTMQSQMTLYEDNLNKTRVRYNSALASYEPTKL